MTEIVEILKKHQLKSLARSDTFTEARDQHIHQKTHTTKAVLGGDDPSSLLSASAIILKSMYFDMVESYTGLHSPFQKDANKSSKALWSRVEAACKEAGCDAERFLKAQFTWFDKAFGTYPKAFQLATPSAVDRAIEFTGSTKGRVLGNVRKAPVTKADTFRASEKLLQQMMVAQGCNREEFYERFVLTGLYTFPKEFLGADPTYQKLVNK